MNMQFNNGQIPGTHLNNPGSHSGSQPPDPRDFQWQYGPSMNRTNPSYYPPAAYQRPPPYQSFLGTRPSGVPPPVPYPNFNVPPSGDYSNSQLDRDYRQFSGRNFEQSYAGQQSLSNIDQGTYCSHSYDV